MPRPVSTLDKSIYIHQQNYGLGGRPWPDTVKRCVDAGANLIKLKALDGPDWMGAYDQIPNPAYQPGSASEPRRVPAPYAVNNVSDWQELSYMAEQAGAQLVPWCVPHGDNPAAELAALDLLANYSGKLLELDIEPYAGFWIASPAALVTLVGSLFERAITVWIDIDPRGAAARALPLAELQLYVTRWISQSYWSTFQTEARREIASDADLFAGLPADDWGCIFPAAGSVDFQAAAEAAAERDAAEIGLWSLNTASNAQLAAFKDIH